MVYNLDFDYMALIFELFLLSYIHIKYYDKTDSIVHFKKLVVAQILMTIFDILSAATNMYYHSLPLSVILLANTLFFLAEAYIVYCFMKYINVIVYKEHIRSRFMFLVDELPIMIFLVCLIANWFVGYMFYVTAEQGYLYGPYHILINIFPIYYFVNVLVKLISFKTRFSNKQILATMVFMLIILVAMSMQAIFWNDILLSDIGCCLALFIMLTSLETPDFLLLQRSLKELEVAKSEAQIANHAKSDFLANMSHEIRTPINAVLGLDEMILRESKEADIIEYAAKIKSAGNTLLSLINDILDFSKIESGKMDIVLAEYDLKPMLTNLFQMIQERARAKALELRFYIDENLPSRMYGDDVRIQQVITNLLTNAVKYTQTGSVTLNMSVCEKNTDCVRYRVSVKDTGIGIKEEDREQLFESFQRIDEIRNRNIEGTGLGLAITLKLLNAMGSSLQVDSVYGEGSDFYFELEQKIIDSSPIGRIQLGQNKVSTNTEVYRESFTAKGARILVVDDNKMNLLVFKGLLKSSQMEITTAQSGKEALELMRNNTYHIVFLDHFMPEMDGIEVLHQMNQEDKIASKKMPVIVLTANAVAGAKEMYINEGFMDFLSKPVKGADIEKVLLSYLPTDLVQKGISND